MNLKRSVLPGFMLEHFFPLALIGRALQCFYKADRHKELHNSLWQLSNGNEARYRAEHTRLLPLQSVLLHPNSTTAPTACSVPIL